MKTLIVAVLLGASVTATAQTNALPQDSSKLAPNDILKLNIAALTAKNISVQYEYVLSKKTSLALGVRIMPTTAVPFENFLINTMGEDDEDTKNVFRISRIGNVAVTPEVRFYMGKGYGEGFYIAPFYRFVHFSSNTLIVNYSEENSPKRSVTLNGEMSAHTLGVMLGAQWFFGKHAVLDFWIAGANYGIASGSFIGIPSPSLTPNEQADIRQTLNNVDIPFINKTENVTANNVTVKTNGAFWGIRSGILFGIRF